MSPMKSSHQWEQILYHLEYPRSSHHDQHGGQDTEKNRKNQLYAHFGGALLGLLAAPHSHEFRMGAQGISNAGAEAVGLNQHRHQFSKFRLCGPLRQIVERFRAAFAAADLKVGQLHLLADVGMRLHQLGRHILHGLVQSETSFDAHHHQIQGIGKPEANALLPAGDQVVQYVAGTEVTKKSRGYRDHDPQDRIRSDVGAEQESQQHQHYRRHRAYADVDRNCVVG